MNIKTIIFDLGGVIVDLDEQATVNAIINLTDGQADEVQKAYQEATFFKSYEKGLISDDTFRDEIRKLIKHQATDENIDKAWNAMLGNIPTERLELMNRLRENYRVMVLSNTNAIHEAAFNQTILEVSGKPDLTHFADTVFFSHELHLRKPDVDIYKKVIELSGIEPSEAIFLDDKLENLEGAQKAGLQTFHVQNPNQTISIEQYLQQQ